MLRFLCQCVSSSALMKHANKNKFGSQQLAMNLKLTSLAIFQDLSETLEYSVALLVEALGCKPEGRGFDS